jgi:signal transduction histidine kinase
LVYAHASDASSALVWVCPGRLISELLELAAPPSGFAVHVEVLANPFKAAHKPLETVLRNLIGNALKHHDREERHTGIRVVEEDAYCHIEVSDDRPGIPSCSQERVFKLFQTVSSKVRKGSGLGRAPSKRLVESHGGRIQLVSNRTDSSLTTEPQDSPISLAACRS